uniref:Uncharacterized protein n=1 Tax=Panagrellus redivivus TaxID=6233 RepID=A0A7E4VYQ2_PANRE
MTSRIAQLSCLTVLAAIILGCSAQTYYGANEDKRNFNREFMHFGKRSGEGFQLFRPVEIYDKRADFNRNIMPFGKRFDYDQPIEKKQFNREFMHFGKRSAPFDDTLVN